MDAKFMNMIIARLSPLPKAVAEMFPCPSVRHFEL